MCAYPGLFSPFFKHEIYALCFRTLYSLSTWSAVINLYEFTASPSHVPKVSFLPGCRCLLVTSSLSLALSLPPSLPLCPSWLPLLVPIIDRNVECRLKSHKIGIFVVFQNSVSVGSGWESVLLAPSFREVRTRATRVLTRGRRHTVEHKICVSVKWF